jgi:hypothetical protein
MQVQTLIKESNSAERNINRKKEKKKIREKIKAHFES